MNTANWRRFAIALLAGLALGFIGCSTDPAGSSSLGGDASYEEDTSSESDAVVDADAAVDDTRVAPSDATDSSSGADSADSADSTDSADASDASDSTDDVLRDTGPSDTGPTFCQSDQDCPMGEICTVDRSGSDVRLTCQPPDPNDGDTGTSCTNDSDCQSNLCYNGSCTEPCTRPAQCKDGWTCDSATISTGGGSTDTINVCQEAPGKDCFSDGDCSGGDKCIAQRGSNKVSFSCGPPNSGGASVGESCSADGDCVHNLCVDGECAPPCGSDGDCSGATDYQCKSTDIDLGNGNTDRASVCRPERPCDNKATCRVNEACFIDRGRSGSAGTCRTPNPGTRSLGDVCSGDSQCPANLCYDGRFQKLCSIACKDNSDCNKAGYRCEQRDIADGMGGTRSIDICVPAPPTPCTNPGECTSSSRSCGVVVDTSGSGLESVCIPNTGGLSTGNSCTSDSDCNSQVCLNGHCSTPCDSRNDCASNQLCRTNTITKNGVSESFKVCETPPEEECTNSGTCSDPVRVCSDLRSNSEIYCQFPNSNATKTLGESCSMSNECESDLCLGDLSGSPFPSKCSAGCQDSSQCATGQICTSIPSTSGSDVAICTKPCSVNGDCSGSNTCQINENRLGSSYTVDTVCEKPPGSKQFGETCSTGGDCESGLCLTTYTFKPGDPNDQTCSPGSGSCPSGWGCYQDSNRNDNYYCAEENVRCTRVCKQDGDCTGGPNSLASCVSVSTTLSDGSEPQINACGQ